MRRTMFTMGFQSPATAYGPQLGFSWDDVKGFLTATSKPPTPAPVVALPAPAPTVLGMDQNTVLIGGAVLLGLGVLVAVVAGRKSATPATAPARKK